MFGFHNKHLFICNLKKNFQNISCFMNLSMQLLRDIQIELHLLGSGERSVVFMKNKNFVVKRWLCTILIRILIVTVFSVSVTHNLKIEGTHLLPNLKGILTSPKNTYKSDLSREEALWDTEMILESPPETPAYVHLGASPSFLTLYLNEDKQKATWRAGGREGQGGGHRMHSNVSS